MINLYGWDFPPKDLAENYVQKCRLFVDNERAFSNFRRDDDYTMILEGGGQLHGKLYLDKIKSKYGISKIIEHIEKFRENDVYGNPYIFDYPDIKNINHNTIMYIYHALDIQEFLNGYTPKRIVEIGGGFGGMCKTFSVLFPFDEYILVDLPEPIALCKKYLGKFPELYPKITFIECNDLEKIENIGQTDLSIAVFSLSECSDEVQNLYADKIIEKSKYSFIGYNKLHIPPVRTIYEKLRVKLLKTFEISYDDSVVDCLYMYLKGK